MTKIITSNYSEEIVLKASHKNLDKVIHADLKETEFDDMVLSVINPEVNYKLRNSVIANSITLTEKSEYYIEKEADVVLQDQLLRVSFWDEINTAVAEGRQISERAIYKGVCTPDYWNRVRDELPHKMAYVLCPVMAFSKANKLGLQLGQRAMLNILNLNPVGENGKTDTRLAQLQFNVFKELQDRIHGKAVQRIQSHNTNETINTNDSIEDLHKEIALLEGKPTDSNPPITVEMSSNE